VWQTHIDKLIAATCAKIEEQQEQAKMKNKN